MKLKSILTGISILFLFGIKTHILAQGFIVDQQSAPYPDGGIYPALGQPAGQSFTPSLSAVGFVSLYPVAFDSSNAGTLAVNLRANSITGTILATSAQVFIPGGFGDVTNFIFAMPVSVTPGTTYYLEPVIISGSQSIILNAVTVPYSGGTLIYKGVARPGQNLWFQEGIIVVPEPSAVVLLTLGVLVWFSSLVLCSTQKTKATLPVAGQR